MSDPDRSTSPARWAPPLVLFAAIAVLAGYAVYLNGLYYARYGSFYDSVSYLNQMAKIMHTVRADGIGDALQMSLLGQTVFFPWLLSMVLGVFTEARRWHAVLLQLPLVLVLAWGTYVLMLRVARHTRPVSVAFALAMVSFQAMFHYNGGLSDLRMDLPQALSFGAALVYFALARYTGERRYWLLSGALLGVAFLWRATTPVYATILFGGFFLFDLATGRGERKRVLKDYLVGAGLAAVVSLWFFIKNFEYLRYYYTVWNFDANAALPWSESVRHLWFLFHWHLGVPFWLLMGAVLAAQVLPRLASPRDLLRRLNWVALMGGLVPVGFLVLFGAALNPFVSIVSVPGLVLFCLAPVRGNDVAPARLQQWAFVAAAAIACGVSAWGGIARHTKVEEGWTSSGAAVRQVTEAIDADLRQRGATRATLEMTYVGSLDSVAILNSFVFDRGFALNKHYMAVRDGMELSMIQPGLANPIEWNAIAGSTPDAKLQTLTDQAITSADYIVVPENGTEFFPSHAVAPHAYRFRDMILARGGLVRVSPPIRISQREIVSVYRNGNRR